MNIYVASSWRNTLQPHIVEILREQGHDVYDFKNPSAGNHGFHWSAIDGGWEKWSPSEYREALKHPIAQDGFRHDFSAMLNADACVLVLPSGRSAHLEAGYFAGARKLLFILIADERNTAGHSMNLRGSCSACGDLYGCHLLDKPRIVPELMYKMATHICLDKEELLQQTKRFVKMGKQVGRVA